MKYDSNYHSVYKINYHMIFCIKYRRKVINENISARLREIFEKISPNYKIKLLEWKYDLDHVHMLINVTPTTELSKFINAYKSASSRLIKKEFPIITKKLWKEFFWSRSSFIVSVGEVPLEIIEQYIQNQGEERKRDGYKSY